MIPAEDLDRISTELRQSAERLDADFATVYVVNMETGAGATGVYPLRPGATGKALLASMIAQALYLKDAGIPGQVLLDTLAAVLVEHSCTACGACGEHEKPN